MSWVRCAFGNLNIVRPELETLSYFHRKPGSFDLRWNIGWGFWAFALPRIFGNSWRCQIHPVTFYMTRKGRRNFKCNILTKHRKLCKPMTFHISNLLHIIFCCTKSQKVKDLSKHCDLEMLTSHIGKRGLYPQYGFILTLLPVGKK